MRLGFGSVSALVPVDELNHVGGAFHDVACKLALRKLLLARLDKGIGVDVHLLVEILHEIVVILPVFHLAEWLILNAIYRIIKGRSKLTYQLVEGNLQIFLF
jgi:hypothetical protein